MKTFNRNLKSTSIIIMFVACLNFVSTIMAVTLANGIYSKEKIMALVGGGENFATTLIGFVIGLAVIGLLISLIIGLKGIIYANGGKKSKLALVFCWIQIIGLALIVFDSASSIISGKSEILNSNIIISIILFVLYIYYVYLTKKVEKSRIR